MTYFPWRALIGTGLCLCLSLFTTTTLSEEEIQDLDSIVAVINEDIIVRSELNSRIDQLTAEMAQRGTGLPPRHILERQVLERLILIKLQLEAADRAGITIDENILNTAVTNIARENNMTLEEFRRAVEAEGIGFERFRDEIRSQITISRLHNQQVTSRILVTDQELKSFLDKAGGTSDRAEYHLLHILIATPEGASPQEIANAQRKAEHLVTQLREGANFRETALAESDGRQALEGGELGWRKANELPSFFTDILEEMERGDISDPVRNSSGFHIIKLEDYTGSQRHIITQTHARHILIRTDEITSDEDARIRLEQLKQRIDGGDDFATLARSHSNDKGSAIKGGDLGWINPGDTVPLFEEKMNLLAINEVSQPFQTQFGWHVLQVLERREHDNTQEVIRAKARNIIRERKAEEETELYLRRLRDEAYVEIRLATQ
jgi:peptidyl-prolyl cis-trans isomerase SurA